MGILPVREEKPDELQSRSGDIQNATIQVQDEDKDVAIALVGERRHALDPTIKARVVRKIDLFLVPAMTVGYGLVYYDKVRRTSNITKIGPLLRKIPRQSWDQQSSSA
jgi:hypothetical protein